MGCPSASLKHMLCRARHTASSHQNLRMCHVSFRMSEKMSCDTNKMSPKEDELRCRDRTRHLDQKDPARGFCTTVWTINVPARVKQASSYVKCPTKIDGQMGGQGTSKKYFVLIKFKTLPMTATLCRVSTDGSPSERSEHICGNPVLS